MNQESVLRRESCVVADAAAKQVDRESTKDEAHGADRNVERRGRKSSVDVFHVSISTRRIGRQSMQGRTPHRVPSASLVLSAMHAAETGQGLRVSNANGSKQQIYRNRNTRRI